MRKDACHAGPQLVLQYKHIPGRFCLASFFSAAGQSAFFNGLSQLLSSEIVSSSSENNYRIVSITQRGIALFCLQITI